MSQDANFKIDVQRLSQAETLENICSTIPLTEMVTVYLSDSSSTHHHGIYCAFNK